MSTTITNAQVGHYKTHETDPILTSLTENHIGMTTLYTYCFYTKYSSFDNSTPLVLYYKSDSDAWTAENHFHINHLGTDYDLLYVGGGIGQGDDGDIYIMGKIKVGANYYNVCVKISNDDVITYKELAGADNFEGTIGDTIVYTSGANTMVALCRSNKLYNWTTNAVTSLTLPTYPLTEKIVAQPFFYYPKDANYAYCGFYGFANDRTNISSLNYYFLTFSIDLEDYVYIPFSLDFEPDIVANKYTRYRILACSQDEDNEPIFCLGAYTFEGSDTGAIDDEYPILTWYLYNDLRQTSYWIYLEWGKNSWSKLHQNDYYQPTGNWQGIVLASALQDEISSAFFIEGATKPSYPFYPGDSTLFTETSHYGYIGSMTNKEGNFTRVTALTSGQYVCTNRLPWTCKTIVCYSQFCGWETFAGEHVPKWNLIINELNTKGNPPKPTYLTEKTFWETYGFNLYCGYTGYFDMKAKEISIYSGGALVVNRTVTDTKRYVEIIAADALAAGTYTYKIRYQDTCNNWGVWSELKTFTIRTAPSVTINSVTDTQFPTINFTVDSYDSLITDITIEIYTPAPALWHTIVIPDPYNYTDGTGVFEYTIQPDLYTKLLANATTYTYKVIVTNDYGKTANDTKAKATNFVAPAAVTALTATDNGNGTCTLAWNTNRGYVYRDNIYIGVCGATYDFTDYDCTLNTAHTYLVCAYDPVGSPGCVAAGVSVTKTLTTPYFALCSTSVSALFAVHQGDTLTHNDSVKYDRISDSIFVDFRQGSCSILGWFTRANRILLEANYCGLQFYLKYSTYSVPVVITGFSANYHRGEQLEGVNIQMEKVTL